VERNTVNIVVMVQHSLSFALVHARGLSNNAVHEHCMVPRACGNQILDGMVRNDNLAIVSAFETEFVHNAPIVPNDNGAAEGGGGGGGGAAEAQTSLTHSANPLTLSTLPHSSTTVTMSKSVIMPRTLPPSYLFPKPAYAKV